MPRAPARRARASSTPSRGVIVGWLDAHPLTAQQVFQRLRDAGYAGGISIVKDYVRTIRPRPRAAFLTLAFAPGELAQADWGEWGTIAVGDTRRRLSFFVMMLAYSRQMYVEFTLSQTMEQFLAAHINAFNALGVPAKVMVDNLRTAVRRHVRGEPAQFNLRYLDFARHYGFEPVACNVARGNEKALASYCTLSGRLRSDKGRQRGSVATTLSFDQDDVPEGLVEAAIAITPTMFGDDPVASPMIDRCRGYTQAKRQFVGGEHAARPQTFEATLEVIDAANEANLLVGE